MGRHAAHWKPYVDAGQMVVFGPVLDSTGSWGLAVVEAEDEGALRAFAAERPSRHERHRADRDRQDARRFRAPAERADEKRSRPAVYALS